MSSKFFRPLPALCFYLSVTPLLAQFGASLEGTVSDSSGAVVPNASITLTNNGTQRTQTTKAGSDGFYRFAGLSPGTYKLTTESQNFNRQVTKNVIVNAEETRGINVTLQPGDVTQTVTVTTPVAPLVQTENAQIGREITTREVESLPQFGRDPYAILFWGVGEPGVTREFLQHL
jgi:hypothetical protein